MMRFGTMLLTAWACYVGIREFAFMMAYPQSDLGLSEEVLIRALLLRLANYFYWTICLLLIAAIERNPEIFLLWDFPVAVLLEWLDGFPMLPDHA